MGADVKERGAERQRGPHHQSAQKRPRRKGRAVKAYRNQFLENWTAPGGGYSSSLTMPTRSNFSVEMTTS